MLPRPLSTLLGKSRKKEVRVVLGKDRILQGEHWCAYGLSALRCTGAEGSSRTPWGWLWEDHRAFPDQEALPTRRQHALGTASWCLKLTVIVQMQFNSASH